VCTCMCVCVCMFAMCARACVCACINDQADSCFYVYRETVKENEYSVFN